MATQTATDTSLVQTARALAPLVADHADAAERERRVPKAVIDELASAGIFHMFVPRAFGGSETELASLPLVQEPAEQERAA